MIEILVFIVLLPGTTMLQDWKKSKIIRKTAEDVVKIVGNKKRTFDDIISELRQPDYRIISQSLDLLIEEEQVGSELMATNGGYLKCQWMMDTAWL